jgi:hypothetical protein
MAIRINDNSSNFSGLVSSTLGAFSCDFDGTYTAPGATTFDGSLNRALNSFNCSFTDGQLQFPRLSCFNLGKNAYLEDSLSQGVREAMSKCDAIVLQPHLNSQIDGSGDAGWLSRAEAVLDIRSRAATNNNPNIYIFFYQNCMETSTTSTYGQKLLSETGPGLPANDDWFGREADGTLKVGPFGPLVNITDFVQADAQGLYAGDWYAINRTQAALLDDLSARGVTIGPGGLSGIFWDNFNFYLTKSSTDMNAANGNEDGQDYYDANNPAHVAADADATVVMGRWRWGYQNCVNKIWELNPDIIQIGNLDSWVRRSNSYSDDLPNPNPVMTEYQDNGDFTAKIQGGLCERSLAWSGYFPRTGVDFDGNLLTAGSWQSMYNAYHYNQDVTQSPSLGMLSADIKGATFLGFSTDGINAAPRFAVWDSTLDSGAAFAAIRWAFATACMANGLYNLNILASTATREQGNYQTCVFPDESGLVNTATTGLSRKWLGRPVDPVQTSAVFNDIWVREFENGIVVLNADNDPANTETVTLAMLGAGTDTYKRLLGVDDPTHNDGSNVTGSFRLGTPQR